MDQSLTADETIEESVDQTTTTVEEPDDNDSEHGLDVTIDEQISPNQVADPALAEWLTVERALYCLFFVTAGLLRFGGLFGQPLSLLEATNAWLAWLSVFSTPELHESVSSSLTPSSPLLHTLLRLSFWLSGDGDVVVRAIPALVGTALVLIPWLLRDFLGRWVALILALLFTLDPWLVTFSRLADGAIFSVALGLLSLASLLCVSQAKTIGVSKRWWTIASLCGGLLLVSGTQAWSFLPVLFLFALFFLLGRERDVDSKQSASILSRDTVLEQLNTDNGIDNEMENKASSIEANEEGREEAIAKLFAEADLSEFRMTFDAEGDDSKFDDTAFDHTEKEQIDGPEDHTPRSDGRETRKRIDDGLVSDEQNREQGLFTPILLLIAIAVLGATSWLTEPAGLGYISSSLSRWISQLFGGEAIAYPLSWVLLRLIVDQPLLLVFGSVGVLLFWATLGNFESETGRWKSFLMLWTLWGLFLVAAPGRSPFSFLILGIPLIFLTAHVGDYILQQLKQQQLGWDSAAFVFTATILFIAGLFFWIALVSRNQFDRSIGIATFVIVLVLFISVVLFGLWANWRLSLLLTGLFAASLLLLVTSSSMWQLSHSFDLKAPDGLFAEVSDPDVRQLATNIATISAQRAGDPGEMPLQVQSGAGPDPVLGWYLHSMRRLTWVPAPAPDERAANLLITMPKLFVESDGPEGYFGSDYRIHLSWMPANLPRYQATADQAGGDNAFSTSDSLSLRWSQQWQPLLRWMLYRKIDAMPQEQSVTLWIPGY
ncbi:hypothetical protein KFU94_15005 [Chloroflexi bacterium TSY]|nr:hypothetical protein [Chloroflexi bacterium TSY]